MWNQQKVIDCRYPLDPAWRPKQGKNASKFLEDNICSLNSQSLECTNKVKCLPAWKNNLRKICSSEQATLVQSRGSLLSLANFAAVAILLPGRCCFFSEIKIILKQRRQKNRHQLIYILFELWASSNLVVSRGRICKRLRSPGIDSASLYRCSLAGRCNNPICRTAQPMNRFLGIVSWALKIRSLTSANPPPLPTPVNIFDALIPTVVNAFDYRYLPQRPQRPLKM
jgi:hypothetical protein